MKKLLKTLMILAFVAEIGFGQCGYPQSALTLKGVFFNYHAPNRDNKRIFADLSNGIEVGYNYHFSEFLSLALPIRLGLANFPIYDETTQTVNSYTRKEFYGGLDALLNLHFFNGKAISPFVYAGVGAAIPKGDFDNLYAQVPLGLGFDIRLSQRINLVLQSDYRIAFEDGYDNWQHAVGLRISLASDRDGDGFCGKMDECPDDWGTVNGCPDADGDMIRDLDDKCPKEAGVPENNGCPADRDKDGVYDKDDKCPDVAGTVMGCPDKDKDGVADKDDACPDDYGTVNGCPDSDKDSVIDKDDKCPKVAGPASNNGCPPDRDKDGVPDDSDPCPDAAGKVNGCPDSDDDGIIDKNDKCPNTKGIAANFGCPEIKVEDKKVLDVAMHAVEFQTGTATITRKSHKNLDDVLKVLAKYPEMNLSIEGHTDDVGDAAFNQKLSEKRAKACMDFLIKKGTKPERLTSVGYGESRPVADNKTNAGRQLNRRTEFNPVWR